MFCSFLVTESDLPSDVRRGLTEINRTKEKLSEKSNRHFLQDSIDLAAQKYKDVSKR